MSTAMNTLVSLKNADRADYTVGDYCADYRSLVDIREDINVGTTNRLYASRMILRLYSDCAGKYGPEALNQYNATHPVGWIVTSEVEMLDDIEDSDYDDYDVPAFYSATGVCTDMWVEPKTTDRKALMERAERIHDDLYAACAKKHGQSAIADYFAAH